MCLSLSYTCFQRSKETFEGLAQHSLTAGFTCVFMMTGVITHLPPVPSTRAHSSTEIQSCQTLCGIPLSSPEIQRTHRALSVLVLLYHRDSPQNYGDGIHFTVSRLSQPGRMESTRRESCISGTTKPNYLLHQTCCSKLKLWL